MQVLVGGEEVVVAGGGVRACLRGEQFLEPGHLRRGAGRRQPGRGLALQQRADLEDVLQPGSAVLQHGACLTGERRGAGHLDPGAAPGPAQHGDEALGLEHAEAFAQRWPGDAELGHEDGLRREHGALGELASHDPPAYLARDQLPGLGYAYLAAWSGTALARAAGAHAGLGGAPFGRGRHTWLQPAGGASSSPVAPVNRAGRFSWIAAMPSTGSGPPKP